ncbi:AlwI family type II restriction endonuclease [Polycladomyces sp. WAk]|uniref:AlwI family type II restriction endonuclease n=1 Tax=Polycladomyces zharkentensis TaxID=2807616 RepID=A0ABS2WMH9_9BACL|nr:AlwI family type II restriction endonuclease [Polycladomyces sp. WAk]MBN2910758.1 AlwI family type II restriction endonuclease [Polycladomyces sp. WAk]
MSRKTWFITRPERDPHFHRDALMALKKATNNFTIKWDRNREVHKEYERALSLANLKRNNVSHDGSGGRTWFALLKTFSYCYTNDDGYIVPTKVGLAILEGKKVFENIKKQILTFQIPNAYFLEPGFRPKFDEGFEIRPILFLIRLTNQELLDYYLTKEEITYFALTAKKDSDLDEVIHKIVDYRHSPIEKKIEMKEEIANCYDHRDRVDKDSRSFEENHSDVAHTFMLISEYTGLVEYIRGKALRVNPEKSTSIKEELDYFETRYPFNKRYLISRERMYENSGLDVDSYKATRMGEKKPASNARKKEIKVKSLLKDYPSISNLSIEKLEQIFRQEFNPAQAKKLAFEVAQNSSRFDQLNNDFVESYLSEENNLKFEDKTGEVLNALGFQVVMRPDSANTKTEIEILLKYGENKCGIIDTKNYRQKFSLSASLASHMASEYIPNYDNFEGRELCFFGYVTANDFGGENNLVRISEKAKKIINKDINGIIISARVLLSFLDYCIENNIAKEKRLQMFLNAIKNRGYKTFGEFMNVIKQV